MKRIAIAAVGLLAGTIGLAAPAAAASQNNGHGLVVDDDHAQCPQAQYTTIQAAVAAAAAGDTIVVCPGSYTGPVLVSKPLTLLGPQRGDAARRVSATPDPTKEAVVSGGTVSSAFVFSAGSSTLDGVYVTGSSAIFQGGVQVSGGSGYQIRNNVVTQNSVGLYLTIDGTLPSSIERNAFVNNNAGGYPSPNTGTGIDGVGAVNNTEIQQNYFQGNNDSSINLPSSTGGLTIERNLSYQDATLLVLGESTGAKVSYNATFSSSAPPKARSTFSVTTS